MARSPVDWIFVHVTDPEDPSGSSKITQVGRANIAEVRSDASQLQKYRTARNLVTAVQLNVGDLAVAILEAAEPYVDEQSSSGLGHMNDAGVNIGRTLLNVLNSFRTLVDHADTALARDFGTTSDQRAMWKAALAKEYDEHFAYRLLYGLRNYSQHLGMPPIILQFVRSVDEPGVRARIDISRDGLLSEKTVWKSSVRAQIEAGPKVLPLVECLDAWSGCFWRIAATLMAIRREAALQAADRTLAHRKRLGLSPGEGQLCAAQIVPKKGKKAGARLTLMELHEAVARVVVAGENLLQRRPGA